MKKSTKRITVIAAIMIVSGILLTVVGFFLGAKLTLTSDENGLKAFDSGKQVSESFSLDSFTNIEGNLDDVDFEIIPSTEFKVEITRQEKQIITHEIKNNTLYLNEKSPSGLNGGIIKFNIDLGFVSTPQSIVKLYVPKDTIFSAINLVSEYGNVQIDGITSANFTIEANDGDMVLKGINSDVLTVTNSYGDIIAEDLKGEQTKFKTNDGDLSLKRLNTKTFNVSNDYGDSSLEDITSTDTIVSMSDGDINLKNVDTTNLQVSNEYGDMNGQSIAAQKLNIALTDGNVTLNTVNTNNAIINNQYGDILLSQFESEALDVQNDSGNVTLEGTLLGTSRVYADYGDIQLILKNKQSELNYKIRSEYGDIKINNEQFEGSVTQTANSTNQLNITAADGDVNLQF